jgi:hypothetical protein
MSNTDTVMPLLTAPWLGRSGERLFTYPLPALGHEAIADLITQWTGILSPEMRQLLQLSCGLADTPLGIIDFTGRWYPEEPLSVLRPSLTLAIDAQGRRWIAEAGRERGLPGPVWCVFPRPEVAMIIDRNLADFLVRLHSNLRRDWTSQWLTSLNIRARKLWACRHARAIGIPVAFSRMRELRGWLAGLPLDASIYDLRAPDPICGLPYGLSREGGYPHRCGRLPVFAFVGSSDPVAFAAQERIVFDAEAVDSSSSLPSAWHRHESDSKY